MHCNDCRYMAYLDVKVEKRRIGIVSFIDKHC